MASNYIDILDSTTPLPASNGDRDVTFDFSAPGLIGGTRPYVSYRVTPTGPVELKIELNGTLIVHDTFQSGTSRVMNEIFPEGVLRSSGNELRVFVPDDETGSLTFSDLMVTHPVAA